jgi:subtilisin family serine protease
MGHHRNASRGRKALSPFAKRAERKRKTWMFERLEDRLVFSVQSVSFSNQTPEGAALTLLDELNWANLAAANAAGQSVDNAALKYATMSLPNDPYFPNPSTPDQPYTQWHLLNVGQVVSQTDLQDLFGVAGQDLNVVPAWNMTDANGNPIDGTGVLVGVIDTGVQLFHPDLAGNISPTLRFNSSNGTNLVSPDLLSDGGFHGTAVAGIIGAVANNGEGGSGVAPGVTIVPIRADTVVGGLNGFSDQSLADALIYAIQHGVDINNLSIGPQSGRAARPFDPIFFNGQFDFSGLSQILRDSVVNGRDGLGMINVFSAGNDGAAGYFGQGFPSLGDWGSASYNPFVNSRYTIGVTGVDHDGLYVNADGTFTSYPESGASVLVAAPTGSSILGATNIGDDDGFGSGIITTDLFGDFGLNAAPLPNGFDPDRDFLDDPNYTSRMNGTSASAPMVSGVIALMLQANPNLTYRDAQEILVRSSRQNAQFEFPTSPGIGSPFQGLVDAKVTWQTNQTGPFRNPDSFFNPLFSFSEFDDHPIADPSTESIFNFVGFPNFDNFLALDTNDFNRQNSSIYEPQPAMFTNGAGYTVSQGYGIYGEQVGYAHGVVDAAAAVSMAKQWHALGQNIDPNTELTYTTSIVSLGADFTIPAAEKVSPPPNGDQLLVPGGLGGRSGFIAYWNQYFVDDPFADYDGPPPEQRGASYVDFQVPPSQEMNVEWVEVKVDLSGAGATDPEGLNALRIMLVSPDGTQSELNNYYVPPSWAPNSLQPLAMNANGWEIDPGSVINQTGSSSFTWTYSTNRSWGESSNSAIITHPVTGEPIMQSIETFDPDNPGLPVTSSEPIFRNWEVHIENWSHQAFNLDGIEVIWHGKPIGGGSYDPNYSNLGVQSAQRVQGVVAIDTNGDNQFSADPTDSSTNQFNTRYTQTVSGQHADTTDFRDNDVTRQLNFTDNNQNGYFDEGDTVFQEPFAEGVIVDAFKVWNGVAEDTPTARFLTGADGNYYFDLDVQGDLTQTKTLGNVHFGQTIEYEIRITDPEGRLKLNDITTPAMTTSDPAFSYLPHYKDSWRINANWFFAADHDNPLLLGNKPGEIFFDTSGTANETTLLNPSDLPEPGLSAPRPWNNSGTLEHIIPASVKNLNFLLKDDAPADQFNVTGTVYSDVNADGQFNGADAAAADVDVYWDKNRNGVFDSGEFTVKTDDQGHYTLPIDLTTLTPVPTGSAPYQIGVRKPGADWTFTDPGQDGVETVFAGPGSADQLVNFFLQPPADQNGNGNGPGTVQGVIYTDLNNNHVQDLGEPGVPNFRVFIDTNLDGAWDSATEPSVSTGTNGAYFFSNVQPGLYRVDIVIPNEGTPAAAWAITTPSVGYRDVQLLPGGSITGVSFALDNLADNDWGDLPESFHTTSAANGPSHRVQLGFQLGATIDGEVNGQPSVGALADTSDDGVVIVSGGGVLQKGANTQRITVSGVGGLLTGWMDFNNDGHFDETERLTWSLAGNSLGGEADLNPGTYDLQITIPASAIDHRPIAARFRWGEQGLSFDGPAQIGEVEDYFLGLNYLAGDYNRDGIVDQADYNLWRKATGQTVTPYSGADGNGDGVVNQGDYDVWRTNFGHTMPGAGAGSALAIEQSGSSSQSSATSAAGLYAEMMAALQGSSGSSAGSSAYYVLNAHPAGSSGSSAFALSPSENAALMAEEYAKAANSSSAQTGLSPGAGLADSPAFALYVADFSSASTASSMSASEAGISTPSNNTSDAQLLLLDQAWGDMGTTSFGDSDDSLYHDESREVVSTNDLALAAVLKEDDDQWNTI